MVSPYIIPLVIVALFYCTLKAQYQGVILVLAAPYVWDTTTFMVVLVFSAASVLFGRLFTAATG